MSFWISFKISFKTSLEMSFQLLFQISFKISFETIKIQFINFSVWIELFQTGGHGENSWMDGGR